MTRKKSCIIITAKLERIMILNSNLFITVGSFNKTSAEDFLDNQNKCTEILNNLTYSKDLTSALTLLLLYEGYGTCKINWDALLSLSKDIVKNKDEITNIKKVELIGICNEAKNEIEKYNPEVKEQLIKDFYKSKNKSKNNNQDYQQ